MLTSDERKARWKSDTDELYRAIGEFVVWFERTCLAISTTISFIFSKAGLKKQSISHVVLAGLTAEPLCSLLESLIAETQDLSAEDKLVVKALLKRFRKLTERRNEIIHSTWFIGFGNEASVDFSQADQLKYHRSSIGAEYKTSGHGADDFSKLTDEAKRLEEMFRVLSACFTFSDPVHKHFRVSVTGEVSLPREPEGAGAT